ALSLKKDGDCGAKLRAATPSHPRFARNEITTSGLAETLSLTITSRLEGRAGSVTTSDLSDEGLKAAVARAEQIRAALPPDPEAVEMLGPQTYPAIDRADKAAADARAPERAAGVKATLDLARKKSLDASGFYENSVVTRAIGNSKGNFGHHVGTEVDFSSTMRTAEG